LIKWIIAAQRTYKPEQIATALQQFYPYALTENNWWGYLDTLLNKIEGKESGRESEAEHEDRKSKEADFARATFGGRGLSKRHGKVVVNRELQREGFRMINDVLKGKMTVEEYERHWQKLCEIYKA